MIPLSQIVNEYPGQLQSFTSKILKDYLQSKILQSVFESHLANKLALFEGSALNFVNDGVRFYDQLVFDDRGLTESQFKELRSIIKKDFDQEGLSAKVEIKTKKHFQLKIRMPGLLFEVGLTGLKDQVIDVIVHKAIPRNSDYKPDYFLLNKFDIYTTVAVVPKEILNT